VAGHKLCIHAADAKFIVTSTTGHGKTVAFAGLKADEPREAKQAGLCLFARGTSGRTDTHV
jgi:hypothetical protein